LNGQPVAPIGGGLNESRSPGGQPLGTYREGRNVRGFDPKTGRMVWGAQRAGLSKLLGPLPDGAHARHFAVASKLIAEREFRSLDLDPLEGADPAMVEEPWSERLDERVLDVARGIDDQGYYLLESGNVVILNSRGKEVGRIYSAVPRGAVAVPRIFVAEDGAVFTSATRDEPLDDVAGYVYRWVKQEDKTYTLAWGAPIKTRISTFALGPGVLYVAEDGVADENGILPEPALTRIGAPSLGPEITWRETVFPRPCFDLTVNPNGQVFSSHPSNPDRQGGATVLFTERNVGWTPYELFNFDIGNVWAWVDAQSVNAEGDQLVSGEAVIRLRDRRFDENVFAELDEGIPERELFKSPSAIFPPPTWDETAFGGVGAVSFSGNASLVSRSHISQLDVEQRALIPGNIAAWSVVALVEFTEEQALASAVRQLIAQRTEVVGQPDWILRVNGLISTFTDFSIQTTQALPTAAVPNTALVTLQHSGAGQAISCRVNGANVVGNVTFDFMNQSGPYSSGGSDSFVPGPRTVLGAGRPNRANLARNTTTTLSTELNSYFPVLNRLTNGVRESSESTQTVLLGGLSSNQLVGTELRIDLGAGGVMVDSLALWSSDTRFSAARAKVSLGNVSFTTGFDVVQEFDVVPGNGDNAAARTEIAIAGIAGALYQFVKIEALTWVGDEAWQLTEVELFQQDASSEPGSAEFNFAEMVVYNGADLSDPAPGSLTASTRQNMEGYIAHRWGVAHTLDSLHPFFGPGNFPQGGGTSSSDQDAAILRGKLNSPFGILAKYGTNGDPLAVYTGAGVGCGAAYSNGKVFAIGESRPGGGEERHDYGTTLTRFKDEQRALVREDGIPDQDDPGQPIAPKVPLSVEREPVAIEVGPCSSLFVAMDGGLRRIDGLTLVEDWKFSSLANAEPIRALPAGLQLDATLQGGDCGPEFLYLAKSGLEGASRITALGLTDTGLDKGRETETLVISSSGDVLRGAADDWEMVEAGALRGGRPASATLNSKTVFCDGIGYRVYDHQIRQLRDFEEAVSGSFPARCTLIAAYRNRLILAGGDNAFTVYQSRVGDVFDFEFGNEVQSIGQAVAGTTAINGLSPEPITALIPWRDDLLYIGTSESLFVLTGDLGDGGRLDHVDKSQGIAPGYAWCESPVGIYYFSGRGGVMLVSPSGLRMVSAGAIQRRLEEIDLAANRIEMAYNWIDKTVHVFCIPKKLGGGVDHFTFEEPTRAWHLDSFGAGYERAVTAGASLIGDTPEDRSLLLGMADGQVYRWDQYADDDAGRAVESFAVVGPLLPESSGVEAHASGIYGQLASDQAGVQVAIRGSNSPDAPGLPGPFKELQPGRGFGVGVNVTAPSLFLEVRGLGRSWSAHSMRIELARRGSSRSIS
jgi:hypothetical protein